jgi:hypothetical protein
MQKHIKDFEAVCLISDKNQIIVNFVKLLINISAIIKDYLKFHPEVVYIVKILKDILSDYLFSEEFYLDLKDELKNIKRPSYFFNIVTVYYLLYNQTDYRFLMCIIKYNNDMILTEFSEKILEIVLADIKKNKDADALCHVINYINKKPNLAKYFIMTYDLAKIIADKFLQQQIVIADLTKKLISEQYKPTNSGYQKAKDEFESIKK